MSFVNNYTAPAPPPALPESELYGPDPYDVNFAWPILADTLQSDRVALTPFVPRVHAETYWHHVGPHPELFRFYPFVLRTLPAFLAWLESFVRRDPHNLFLAVLDKTRPDPAHPDWAGSLAGVLVVANTVPDSLRTEIGFIVVFPAFQRTHVATNMVALALRYLLQLPTQNPPGIGFRRVAWSANPVNAASTRLAERVGFRVEGIQEYLWVLPDDALFDEGSVEGREGDAFSGRKGRHTVALGITFKDWENGGREKAQAMIDRHV